MTTFDSTKRSLTDILRDIISGRIKLPDFQRGWVWDDDHIRDLLVSIARSFPIGAIMLLETGGGTHFKVRPVEGVTGALQSPDSLILDGQQRLTTLTQAIALISPVTTRTSRGNEILRHYYFNIRAALSAPDRLEEAIVATDKNRKVWGGPFSRELLLDLSTRALECQHLHFPCDQILDYSDWQDALIDYDPLLVKEAFSPFRRQVIDAFRNYDVPIITLRKETPKEAVCLVFEKVNTGGVTLNVFELITATYAADGFNLRDDWLGNGEEASSRKHRLAVAPLLREIEPTQFLQAVTLLHTYDLRQQDIAAGKEEKQRRPVSAKRADILDLPLEAYQRLADPAEEGFRQVAHFLQMQSFFRSSELPYAPQVIPLAAILARLGNRWLAPRIFDKLSRWFWCGALGELYGGATETRIANDMEELLGWIEEDTTLPRTIQQAFFDPERLFSLRTRNSAAYKAVNTLVLRGGARDFFWKVGIEELNRQDINRDIHHIFPVNWCLANHIPVAEYNSILNKTTISASTNRKIGAAAPSRYLQALQVDPQVQLADAAMDAILESHLIPVAELRADDFAGFLKARQQLLLGLIAKAMGKPVMSASEPA